ERIWRAGSFMIRLRDRNRQIPNGMRFHVPEIPKWKPPQYASLDVIARAVINLRNGNPFLKEKNGWSTNYEDVANEVDLYNAKICQAMGWKDYIITDEAVEPPKGGPLPSARNVRGVAAGAKSAWTGIKILHAW